MKTTSEIIGFYFTRALLKTFSLDNLPTPEEEYKNLFIYVGDLEKEITINIQKIKTNWMGVLVS